MKITLKKMVKKHLKTPQKTLVFLSNNTSVS